MLQESLKEYSFCQDHVKFELLQLYSDVFIILAIELQKKKNRWETFLTLNEKWTLSEIATKNRSLWCNTNNLPVSHLKVIVSQIVKLALWELQ